MKTAFEVKVILGMLIVIVATLVVHSTYENRKWENQISINQELTGHIEALDSVNAGQWKRISEIELMLCNPDLIKCGK